MSRLSRSFRQGSRRVRPRQSSVGSLISGPMAHPSSISQKTRQAQTFVGYSNSDPGKSGQFTRTSRARPLAAAGDLDGENVAVVRPVDEVVADHATPFGSSPQIEPISRKFQRTARGSMALVADGIHMSTHAGALLPAALAYTYARVNRSIPRSLVMQRAWPVRPSREADLARMSRRRDNFLVVGIISP